VRVYDCGGFVNEQKRVDGILSLSRALGDNDLQPHVTYEPEVFTVDLRDDDQFVILACDGLWDVVTNEQAVEIAGRYRSPSQAAAALRDYAHMLGTTDNISVIVYRLDVPIEERRQSPHASEHERRGSAMMKSAPTPQQTTPNKGSKKDDGRKRRNSDALAPLDERKDEKKEEKKKKSSSSSTHEKDDQKSEKDGEKIDND